MSRRNNSKSIRIPVTTAPPPGSGRFSGYAPQDGRQAGPSDDSPLPDHDPPGEEIRP